MNIHTIMNFVSFEEARELARKSGIKSARSWVKAGQNRPEGTPCNPERRYRGFGWISWGDFLGTGAIIRHHSDLVSFEEARDWARRSGIKTSTQWFSKSRSLPNFIPAMPHITYRGKGWTDWGDFLGTNFLLKKEASEIARNAGIKNKVEWDELARASNGKLPVDIYGVYGVKSIFKFLGTTRKTNHVNKVFLDFESAREFARGLHLGSSTMWNAYICGKLPELGPRPDNVHSTPSRYYAGKGWRGWKDFLGGSYNPKDPNSVKTRKNQFGSGTCRK